MSRAAAFAVALALASALASSGCSRAAPDATPEGAVRLFVEKMETGSEDPRAMREAYQLLGPHARATVHCTHEANAWRVEPELPDVLAPQRRADGGT